jgi:hypothetical protein
VCFQLQQWGKAESLFTAAYSNSPSELKGMEKWGDYDWQRNPKLSEKSLPMTSHYDHKPTWNSLGLNPSFADKIWTTCFLLYGVAYRECPRRNVQYFGRVFLMLNYTDITQNTYMQS